MSCRRLRTFGGRKAQFKDDLPNVLASLRETIEDAERDNAEYQDAAAVFLELCHQSIGPDVSARMCGRCCCSTS